MNDLSTDTASSNISNFVLEYAIVSDIGKRRNENQDAFARTRTAKSHLFVVADGMGGARGGATASTIAVNIVGRKSFSDEGVVSAESLKKALELANHVVHSFGTRDEELAGMGTTVVALAITGEDMVIGFVGDSRIYCLQDSQFSQLSHDHTLIQELIDSGAVAEDEVTNHPISHMLTRSLGPMSKVWVETLSLAKKVKPGDVFLLCCDGLYNLVTDEEIKNILSKSAPREAAERLVGLANERGGVDNITVEVIKVLPKIQETNLAEAPTGVIECQYSGTAHDLKIQIDFDQIDATLAKVMLSPQVFLPDTNELDFFPDRKEQDTTEETIDKDENIEEGISSSQELSAEEETPSEREESYEQMGQPQSQVLSDQLELKKETSLGSEEIKIKEVPFAYENTGTLAQDESWQVDNRLFVMKVLVSVLFVAVLLLVIFIRPIINSLSSLSAQSSDTKMPREVSDNSFNSSLVVSNAQPKEPAIDNNKESEKNSGNEASLQINVEKNRISFVSPDFFIPEDLRIDREQQQKFARLIAAGSDFSDSNQSAGEIINNTAQNVSPQAMQPIYWEAEREKVKKLNAQMDLANNIVSVNGRTEDRSINEPNIKPEEERGPSEGLSNDAKLQLMTRKQTLRDKVFDIDAKLKVIAFSSQQESDSMRGQLEIILRDVSDAIEYKTKEKEYVEKSIKDFKNYQKQIKEKGFENLVELPRIIEQSQDLIAAYDAYNASTLEYKESLSEWKEDPSDTDLSAKMVAKGNNIRVTQNQLQSGIDDFISLNLKSKTEHYLTILQQIHDLERHRDRINRQIGFVIAYSSNSSSSQKTVVQRELLETRRILEKEYKDLSVQLPDKEEQILLAETLQLNTNIPE